MRSKSLVICDPEKHYAQALASYIMNRRGINFEVHVCSGIEHIQSADLLLISDVYSEQERLGIEAEKVFILSGGMENSDDENIICKYQTGEQILESILNQCGESYLQKSIFFAASQKKKGKLIGIFSPVHRIGKTSYALKIGEAKAVSENVLYLNLELYGGIGGHFEKGGQTLEDILYYTRQERGDIGFLLTKAVKHKGNLDYILPAPVSEDIKEIQPEEWMFLLQQIMEQSIYETIVLDIDEGIRGIYELLEICTEVHLLTDQTEYSQAKIEQFERELFMLGHEEILQKIIRKELSV